MRILVVDDDPVFRQELSDLLVEDGHNVASASSAPKAIDVLTNQEVDVVLTDLKMPRQSGLELLAEIRHRWPRTLVVMITGYATVETALEAMKLGAFDYIRKPFRAEQVQETLRLVAQEHAYESAPDSFRDPMREARALAETGQHDVLLLGPYSASSEEHLTIEPYDPGQPVLLVDRVEGFVASHPKAAVVIAGIDRMVEGHRLEDIVAVLDQLRSDLAGHGPLRVGLNPRRVSESVATALAGAVAKDETDSTLEALASPIRRNVLHRLAEGPASFGDAMQSTGLVDSPKLSFHLRRLVDAGLVTHEGEQVPPDRAGGSGRPPPPGSELPPADRTRREPRLHGAEGHALIESPVGPRPLAPDAQTGRQRRLALTIRS